jgi:hypothetical protein
MHLFVDASGISSSIGMFAFAARLIAPGLLADKWDWENL